MSSAIEPVGMESTFSLVVWPRRLICERRVQIGGQPGQRVYARAHLCSSRRRGADPDRARPLAVRKRAETAYPNVERSRKVADRERHVDHPARAGGRRLSEKL